MSSYDYGKADVCDWIRKRFPVTATILDMGAGDGKWKQLLPEYEKMDAVEKYEPNARKLQELYRMVFCDDLVGLKYRRYSLVLFGDVIEHLSVENATEALQYAEKHASAVIVAVPYQYPQGAIYGNPYEVHIQDDLTPEIFDERYPGYRILWNNDKYCYYVKEITNAKQRT